jgi:microcystin-dependent protein
MTTRVTLIGDGAVNSGSIFNGTINSEDLNSTAGEQAVTTNNIRDKAVTTSKINFETALVPLGGIIMWSGTTTPVGWQLCNETDLPSTSPLRPGITKTPNLQDRFIVGAGSGYAVGDTGGANSITLGTNNVPYHNHGGSTDKKGSHYHQLRDGRGGNQTNSITVGGGCLSGQNIPTDLTNLPDIMSAEGEHNHEFATDFRFGNAQGGTDAHENRPPYYALAFIMRVL